MDKKIIITRANHQAQAFAAAIVNQVSGINMNDFVFEPMTEIVHFPFNTSKFEDYDGIIMTSMNAAVSLELNAPARDLLADKQFYCVGEHTRQKILSMGAQDVAICTPMAEDLFDKMFKGDDEPFYADKKFLYLRGRDVPFDIKNALSESDKETEHSVSVEEIICYEAKAIERFSPNIAESLLPGEVGLITFFSKRTAEIFARLWAIESEKEGEYKTQIEGVKALCISQDVVDCVENVFDKGACTVAKKPNMAGMINQIEKDWT